MRSLAPFGRCHVPLRSIDCAAVRGSPQPRADVENPTRSANTKARYAEGGANEISRKNRTRICRLLSGKVPHAQGGGTRFRGAGDCCVCHSIRGRAYFHDRARRSGCPQPTSSRSQVRMAAGRKIICTRDNRPDAATSRPGPKSMPAGAIVELSAGTCTQFRELRRGAGSASPVPRTDKIGPTIRLARRVRRLAALPAAGQATPPTIRQL